MTRERYSLTVRLRGRIFISSIVYFRGWREDGGRFSLSLSLAFLAYSPSGGKHRPVDDAESSAGIRVLARRVMMPLGIDSSVTNCIMASSRDTREGIEPWDNVCQRLTATRWIHGRTFRKQENRKMIGLNGSLPFRSTLWINKFIVR